eukprot:TRINITY_DN30056_c0_g1_i1.p1 TRINITY_DN30056_c0_g1~~TRINITY_DN30056_c0_g1_i1.p1  ORF type:complete len:112 (+),score=9.63 TRINITY_DN30056_c0_g1_i1:435-770(+)
MCKAYEPVLFFNRLEENDKQSMSEPNSFSSRAFLFVKCVQRSACFLGEPCGNLCLPVNAALADPTCNESCFDFATSRENCEQDVNATDCPHAQMLIHKKPDLAESMPYCCA